LNRVGRMSNDSMYNDLYQAITKTNNWDVIKRVDPRYLSRTYEIGEILAAMEHPELFSGFSLMMGFYYMQDIVKTKQK